MFQIIADFLKGGWNWVAFFFPIKFAEVDRGEGLVLYTWGKPKKMIREGCVFYTSCQKVYKTEILMCKNQMEPIEVPTYDNIPLELYPSFTYDIVDLIKFYSNAENTHFLLEEIAKTIITGVITSKCYEEFKEEIIPIGYQCLENLQKKADELELGVKIRFLRFESFKVSNSSLQVALASDLINSIFAEYTPLESARLTFILANGQLVHPTPDSPTELSLVEQLEALSVE